MRKHEILLVDDDPFILKTLGPALEGKGYQISTATTGEEAIEIMAEKGFDLVITDLVMQSIDGIDVLKKAKKIDAEMTVMILTGFGDMTSAIDALRLGADDYMLKPCQLEEIYFRVSSCLEKMELKRKIKIYEDILPVCCVCKSIRDDTGKEPGTGKWTQMENYIRDKGGVGVTSTYCPECAKKAKEELARGLAE